MNTLALGLALNGQNGALGDLYSARPDAPVVDDGRAPRTARAARTPLRRTRRATAGVLHRAATRIAPVA